MTLWFITHSGIENFSYSVVEKGCLLTGWILLPALNMRKNNRYVYLPGEKAVFMNPNTERAHIDNFMKILTEMSQDMSSKKVAKI
ncbi:pyridoxal-dependent decarboxylase [Proteus vulgaris]|nr:pyridoxal-dependent decarboxylase [Proteus vulgaris]